VVDLKQPVVIDDGNIEGIVQDLRQMLAGRLVDANVTLLGGGCRPYPQMQLCLNAEKAIGVMRPQDRIIVTDSSALWIAFIDQTPFMFETVDLVEVNWVTPESVVIKNLHHSCFPDPIKQVVFTAYAA